jgi:tetratricopeptide (TPR) repeat protein
MNKILSTLRDAFEKKPVLFSVLLITVVLLIFYSNSFTAEWHYDDFHHIKENINIRKISNIPTFFTDPTTFSRNPNTRMYRPLLMSTYAANYQLALLTGRDGYNFVGYHVVNFLFHLLSTLGIFFVVRFLFRERIPLQGVDPFVPALFSALLFGLNTINTETVVYISSRSSAMATMFLLGSFFAYLKAAEEDRVKWSLMALSAFLYGCGLLSKEIAITLPAMLVLYELLLNRKWMEGGVAGILRGLFVRTAAHGTVALVYLGMRRIILSENLVTHLTSKGGAAASNLTSQLATQSRAWVYYIREWLLPTSLSIDKPFAVSRNFADPKVLFSILMISLIIAGAVLLRKKHPAVIFGILWWFTALLPTTLFRLNVPINDHRLYLSGFGAVLVFTYVASRLYIRFKEDGGYYLKGFVALCVATLLLMGMGTLKRNSAFATEETMWKDVILKDRKSVRGYNNLGIYYEQHGEWDKALAHYQQTIKLAPMFPNPYINIGNVYHKKKDYEKAEQWMKRAIQLDQGSALANYNLGNILREAGKTAEAIAAYNRALQLNPRYIEAANNLANIYFKMREFNEAITYYQKALFIDPTFAMSYYNIGLAHENLRQYDKAAEAIELFLRFWNGDPKYIRIAQGKLMQFRKMR